MVGELQKECQQGCELAAKTVQLSKIQNATVMEIIVIEASLKSKSIEMHKCNQKFDCIVTQIGLHWFESGSMKVC